MKQAWLSRPRRLRITRQATTWFLCVAALGSLFAEVGRAQSNATGAAPASSVTPVLHTTARMVIVDVVVHNRQQNAVSGLKVSDFTITDNGKPQSIHAFDEHTPEPITTEAKIPEMPPGEFTNDSSVDAASSLNIILLDLLNTPLADQTFARDQAIAYLRKGQFKGRTAIFALTTRLLLLRGFSSDPKILLTAFAKKDAAEQRQLLQPADSTNPDESSNDSIAYASEAGVEGANAQNFEGFTESFRKQLRVRYTLDGLDALGRYLANLPGRKNLIWFSGGFPVNILPEEGVSRDADPFAGAINMEDEFRETTNLLSRARVAVYPVDSRGLVGFSNIGGRGALLNSAANKAQFQNMTNAHTTMNLLADQTGGKAFYNTNGLSEAMSEAVTNGSTYYAIAYTPTDTRNDGSFHSIHVSIDRPGVTLQYRRGYYSDKAPVGNSITASASVPQDPALRIAMMHGAPPLNDLIFRVAVAPTTDAVHSTSSIRGLKNLGSSTPLRTFEVHFAVDISHLGFARVGEDHFHPDLRFVVFVYDASGDLCQAYAQEPGSSLSKAQIRTARQRGLQFPLNIDVPESGSYFLRIGVEDRLNSRIGSVEIPVAPLRILPPVAALATEK